MMLSYSEKCSLLRENLLRLGKDGVLLAFSGGVDSSLLLAQLSLARRASGADAIRFECALFCGVMFPHGDLDSAKRLASKFDSVLNVFEVNDIPPALKFNPRDRCYLCKRGLFERLKVLSSERSLGSVVDGTNADDLHVYRPGLRALSELGVSSPLAEAGFTKAEVRRLASETGLDVAERPSSPCLATRFEYGAELTLEKLSLADEAEKFIRPLIGAGGDIRVRFSGLSARIEVSETAFDKVISNRGAIIEYFESRGILHISLDLSGFRSGSMDIDNKQN